MKFRLLSFFGSLGSVAVTRLRAQSIKGAAGSSAFDKTAMLRKLLTPNYYLFVYLLQYLWHSIYAVAVWAVINRSRLITADDRQSYILSKFHKSKKPVI